ncbi:MAG TPA: hypothetical protein VG456_15235, partial [Candidatus Sulfopaludibacter sp.]|nr:hypothetical protein [Candidatus Sulfopaludibacter sp.]
EPTENFQEYLDQHIDRFQPADDVEMNLVEEMVAAAWRERRSAGLQTQLFNQEFDDLENSGDYLRHTLKTFNKLATSPAIALLQRYETRYHLTYHRSMATLLKLQKVRQAESPIPNEPKPQPDPDPIAPIPNEPEPPIPSPDPLPSPARSADTTPSPQPPTPVFPIPCLPRREAPTQPRPLAPGPRPLPSGPSLLTALKP